MGTGPAARSTNGLLTLARGGAGCQLLLYLPYELWPHGEGFWTALCYRSDGNYPREGFGGIMVERFGRWAFYAE